VTLPRPVRRLRADRGFRLTDRATIAIGVLAVGATAAALTLEARRIWRRTPTPEPGDWEGITVAAGAAVGETVETVVAGYRGGSTRENALFNMLVSFVASLLISRGIAYQLRRRSTFGPFRNVRVGRRHVHHFVPGIAMAFAAGTAAITTRNEDIEPWLAIPFGAGMGMTLDESALLLELDDVYWTEEGVVGMQIALAVAALLGALAVGLRFVRRGERLILPEAGVPKSFPAAVLSSE